MLQHFWHDLLQAMAAYRSWSRTEPRSMAPLICRNGSTTPFWSFTLQKMTQHLVTNQGICRKWLNTWLQIPEFLNISFSKHATTTSLWAGRWTEATRAKTSEGGRTIPAPQTKQHPETCQLLQQLKLQHWLCAIETATTATCTCNTKTS